MELFSTISGALGSFGSDFTTSSYVAGAATWPAVRIIRRGISAFDKIANIMVFFKMYPRLSKFLYITSVLGVCAAILTGCTSHNAVTANTRGHVTHGPFAELCPRLSDAKMEAWRNFANCAGTVLGMQVLDTDACSKQVQEFRQSDEKHRQCLESKKKQNLNFNATQSSAAIRRN